jgi:hypothetical protein
MRLVEFVGGRVGRFPVARAAVFATLAVATLSLPGCIIVAKSDGYEYERGQTSDAQLTPNWASIRAARGINSSSSRADALVAIAQRTDLTQSEQYALVDAARHNDLSSSDATRVYQALVNNSTSTIDTRNALASSLGRASLSSSDRKAVTDALIATTPATTTK